MNKISNDYSKARFLDINLNVEEAKVSTLIVNSIRNLYEKIGDEVQRNLDKIREILKVTTEKIYQIEESYKTKSKSKASVLNFNDFSFVKKDLSE